ncbi:hypothetical protein FPV67DRAFT_1429646 [Lyophyllum atratum]|nr:hypothetical protein FPV67DRAFT_1429646 [Lyophyllum atratum]
MDIAQQDYPGMEHVFIYDNAPSHLKRADGAPSARYMPKFTPPEGKNWEVEVTKRTPDGKPVYTADGKYAKIKIPMSDATLASGQPQPLYFGPSHPRAGVFKGMAEILVERGYDREKIFKLRAQCDKFKCAPGAVNCCCRRLLFTQPDFVDAPTLLETHCAARGFKIIFLPKFHCELNFIEQCWGYAKRLYRLFPESSKEDMLEKNALEALDAIPIESMRRFATRSQRFMAAYQLGLNGRQAAWAARKYKGHRVLPEKILQELELAGVQ